MIVHESFSALLAAIDKLKAETLKRILEDSRKGGYPKWKSRGVILIGPDRAPKDKSRPTPRDRFGGGCYEWNGTKKELLKAIEEAKAEGFDELYVEEFWDGAEKMEDFRHHEYEPSFDGYYVKVWEYTGEGPEIWSSSASNQ